MKKYPTWKEDNISKRKISCFIDHEDSPIFQQMSGLDTRILTGLHGEKMMMVLNDTLPGHSVPMHTHPHEQVGVVFSGKGILRIGDEGRRVQKGDFYCIPGNVPHGDTCLSDEPFVMLDIFYPVREDFIEKLKLPPLKQHKKKV
jgi:quercetin dioxygenase-like cupin family protein